MVRLRISFLRSAIEIGAALIYSEFYSDLFIEIRPFGIIKLASNFFTFSCLMQPFLIETKKIPFYVARTTSLNLALVFIIDMIFPVLCFNCSLNKISQSEILTKSK